MLSVYPCLHAFTLLLDMPCNALPCLDAPCLARVDRTPRSRTLRPTPGRARPCRAIGPWLARSRPPSYRCANSSCADWAPSQGDWNSLRRGVMSRRLSSTPLNAIRHSLGTDGVRLQTSLPWLFPSAPFSGMRSSLPWLASADRSRLLRPHMLGGYQHRPPVPGAARRPLRSARLVLLTPAALASSLLINALSLTGACAPLPAHS